jgi:hypothetical protein
MVLVRSSIIACLIVVSLSGCTGGEPKLVVGKNAAEFEKKILLALFRASELKIDMDACESHEFAFVGEFLAEIFSAEGRLQRISLLCPKQENEKLFCEFNIDHGKDNTLVRFVYNKENDQLLKAFTPECIRVP